MKSKTPLTDKLKKYFENTPTEQVLKDWEDYKEYDKQGHVTVDEFISGEYRSPILQEILDEIPESTKLKVDILSGIVIAKSAFSEEEWDSLIVGINYLVK